MVEQAPWTRVQVHGMSHEHGKMLATSTNAFDNAQFIQYALSKLHHC